MTKPTFRPRGRPDNSTSCFNKKKMRRHMGKQTPRGDNLVKITVRASIQTQK